MTEVLSLFRAVTCTGVAAAWGGALLAAGVAYGLVPGRGADREATGRTLFPRPYIVCLALILFITLMTALVSPPNNFDSMTYHLGRIIHWMQNRSVEHFPTHIGRQLYSAPFAEFVVMHLHLLGGSDRLVNLAQWFSMASTLVAVALLAGQLGGGAVAAPLAAVFCATIPMGILQSSSTQNDYVAGFWLACFVFFSLHPRERALGGDSLAMAASLGLAILTKGTVYPLAFPFVVWMTLRDLRKGGARGAATLLTVGVVVLALNAGHYGRNYHLYGNPVSTGSERLANEVVGLGPTAVNGMRNLVMQFASPFAGVNQRLERGFQRVCSVTGIDCTDQRTSLGPFRLRPLVQFHEDFAVNPLHTLLIVVACGLAITSSRLRAHRSFIAYVTTAVCSYLLFSALLKWQPFGSRLLLPLFLIWSPAVAVALAVHLPERCLRAVAVLLSLASLPWLLFNTSRPLFSIPAPFLQRLAPGVAAPPSILVGERDDIYFANKPLVRKSQEEVAVAIRARGCTRIGLQVGDDYWEYTLWTRLAASGGGIPPFEHVMVANRSGTLPHQPVDDRCVVTAGADGVSNMLLPALSSRPETGKVLP
jgi:4-amino-4-deoxy-L-arabinose transferase-like glycosyltransferase